MLLRLALAVVCAAAVAAAEAEAEADSGRNANFLAWLATNGATHPPVILKDFEDYGKGVLTVQPVKHGDMLMDVPADIILSRATLVASAHRPAYLMSELLSQLQNDEDVLAVVLAREKLLGDQSFWKPYLDVLPGYVPQPVLFSSQEVAELQHPSMQARVKEMQKLLRQRGTAVAKFIQQHGADMTEDEALDLYRWGISLVQSRALTFRGRKYLCPLADMFNYSPRNEKREANAGESFLRYHQLSSEGLQIYADRDCDAGVQLFEDYGDNKDEIYFLYHGFIAATNPFRCLPIQLSLQHITGFPDKLRLLRLFGFHSPPNPCIGKHGAGLLTATIAAATDLLTGYETTDCIDALSGSNMAEQRQINAFLYSGDCASPGFQLLDKLKRGNSHDRCPLLVALLLTCTGDSDAWASNKRAAHVLAEGFAALQQRLDADAEYFATDLDTDHLAQTEALAKLSQPHLDDAERRHTEKLQLALQYRMLRKQLHREVSGLLRRELPSTELPSLDERVNQLNDWLAIVGCAKNVIKASVDPDYRVKAVATKPIREGEVYLSVPVSAIMDSDAANADPQFGAVPAYLQKQFGRREGYHELLLFLLHEYFVRRTESRWWPYLQMLPTPGELLNPLLFNGSAVESIKPSVLHDQTVAYQARVAKSFSNLQRLKSLTHFLPPHILSFENYRWATAILDSRSIWWNGHRHLVPLLDTINCKQGPPGAKVHSTKLDSRSKFAETRAPWAFKVGEQVFENYGQPNHIYFLYHGFVLEENAHDCVLAFMSLDEELLRDYPKQYEDNKELLGALQYSKGRITACLRYPLPIEFVQFMQLKHLLETTKVCDHACATADSIHSIEQLIQRYEQAAATATTHTTPPNVVQLHRAEVAHLKSILAQLQQRRDSTGPLSEL